MNKLMEAFGEIAKLSSEAEQAFLSSIDRRQVPKKELLQTEGMVCNEVFFIEKGICNTTSINVIGIIQGIIVSTLTDNI